MPVWSSLSLHRLDSQHQGWFGIDVVESKERRWSWRESTVQGPTNTKIREDLLDSWCNIDNFLENEFRPHFVMGSADSQAKCGPSQKRNTPEAQAQSIFPTRFAQL